MAPSLFQDTMGTHGNPIQTQAKTVDPPHLNLPLDGHSGRIPRTVPTNHLLDRNRPHRVGYTSTPTAPGPLGMRIWELRRRFGGSGNPPMLLG